MNSITINGNVTVNGSITFNELVDRLGYVERVARTPKWIELDKTGDPMIAAEGVRVYPNGYAVYENDAGKAVLWVKDCATFTYYFDSNPCEWLPHKSELSQEYLGEQPWFMAIMLRGDHQIDANVLNRTGSRRGTQEDIHDNQKMEEDTHINMHRYIDPATMCILRDTAKEKLGSLTSSQMRAYLLYYVDGFKQKEISERMGISVSTANQHIQSAYDKAGNIYRFLIYDYENLLVWDSSGESKIKKFEAYRKKGF